MTNITMQVDIYSFNYIPFKNIPKVTYILNNCYSYTLQSQPIKTKNNYTFLILIK